MTTAKVALHVLASGLVVDRSLFVLQSAKEMDDTIAKLRAMPKKPVTVIENGVQFFTAANMLDIIKSGGQEYKLIAEKAGVTLRAEDVQAIVTAEATKKAIEASMVPPIPPYSFAEIPKTWSIAMDLRITTGDRGTVSRRRTNTSGNGTGYSISLLQLKRVWAVASKYWATGHGQYTVSDVRASGYGRRAVMVATRVDIGCQSVQRYELEQLALHLGWEFPTPAK